VRRHLAPLTIILALAGCQNQPAIIPIETAPVNGTATYQGKPLEDYRVYFYAESAAAKEPATGKIDAEGNFTLSVRDPGDGGNVGKNVVWFAYDPTLPEEIPGRETGKAPPPPKVVLPKKYLNQETSGLSVEITKDGLKDYKLDLK
jgi:hypothetical protein